MASATVRVRIPGLSGRRTTEVRRARQLHARFRGRATGWLSAGTIAVTESTPEPMCATGAPAGSSVRFLPPRSREADGPLAAEAGCQGRITRQRGG